MMKRRLLKPLVLISVVLVLCISLPLINACTSPSSNGATTTVTTTATTTKTQTVTQTGTATPTTTYTGEPITLRFNLAGPAWLPGPAIVPFRPDGRFEYLVDKYSGGKLKIEVIEMLYELSLEAVADGRIEMGGSMTPDDSGSLPLPDFPSLPGLFAPFPTGVREIEASIADPRMQEILSEVYREKNIVNLSNTIDAPQLLWGTKPVATLDDWNGLKVRTSGLIQAATTEALGANPIIVTDIEIEQLLIRGTVDAACSDAPYGAARGFLDICDYVSVWDITPTMVGCCYINADVWDELPEDFFDRLVKADP
jgi:TRAP-type mannitol/chloroaromatic compound transport system substrate-binding protein